ncbi:MAG: hypothetical protein CMM50_08970 [Rhodospirillaceae bacterium]|nr:hypothetical protein [Rhodospirillaceae bacterium]
MPLLGKGVMAFWNDITAEGEADFNHWHVYEHIPERVGVPGFLRGRRYTALSGTPKYFNFYETENVGTLTSKPYLDRLNDPTPWSKRSLANFRNSNRTLCDVTLSQGRGEGAVIATFRLSAAPGRADALREWLAETAFPALAEQPGIVAVHLLEADQTASRAETKEKSIRDKPDEVADWVILLEGVEAGPVEAARADLLSDASLAAQGATKPDVGIYRLLYSLSEIELPAKG